MYVPVPPKKKIDFTEFLHFPYYDRLARARVRSLCTEENRLATCTCSSRLRYVPYSHTLCECVSLSHSVLTLSAHTLEHRTENSQHPQHPQSSGEPSILPDRPADYVGETASERANVAQFSRAPFIPQHHAATQTQRRSRLCYTHASQPTSRTTHPKTKEHTERRQRLRRRCDSYARRDRSNSEPRQLQLVSDSVWCCSSNVTGVRVVCIGDVVLAANKSSTSNKHSIAV